MGVGGGKDRVRGGRRVGKWMGEVGEQKWAVVGIEDQVQWLRHSLMASTEEE